jgi:hypothetical protein
MKSWKRFEIFCADYLGWKRNTKQHYGHSICDIEGDGFKGECKNYKAMRIHSLKQEIDNKYKDDVILFTKLKGTKFEPCNVLVTINLELFRNFLSHYKLNRNKDVKFNENNNLTMLLRNLDFRLNICKDTLRAMEKIIKDIKEVK